MSKTGRTDWLRKEKSVGKWYRWTRVSENGPLSLCTLYFTSRGRLLRHWRDELYLCKVGQTEEDAEHYAQVNGFGPRVAPSCTVEQYLAEHPELDPGIRPSRPVFPKHPF